MSKEFDTDLYHTDAEWFAENATLRAEVEAVKKERDELAEWKRKDDEVGIWHKSVYKDRAERLQAEVARLKEQLREAGERWKHEPCIQEVTRLREREKGLVEAAVEVSHYHCPRCGSDWFRTPDTRSMGPDGIVVCKSCGHKFPRSEWRYAKLRAALSGEAKDGGKEKRA